MAKRVGYVRVMLQEWTAVGGFNTSAEKSGSKARRVLKHGYKWWKSTVLAMWHAKHTSQEAACRMCEQRQKMVNGERTRQIPWPDIFNLDIGREMHDIVQTLNSWRACEDPFACEDCCVIMSYYLTMKTADTLYRRK